MALSQQPSGTIFFLDNKNLMRKTFLHRKGKLSLRAKETFPLLTRKSVLHCILTIKSALIRQKKLNPPLVIDANISLIFPSISYFPMDILFKFVVCACEIKLIFNSRSCFWTFVYPTANSYSVFIR